MKTSRARRYHARRVGNFDGSHGAHEIDPRQRQRHLVFSRASRTRDPTVHRLQVRSRPGGREGELKMIPTPPGPVVEKALARGTRARTGGWLLVTAGLCMLLFALIGGALPLSELFALGRDTVLPPDVPAGVVAGLSPLDLFQLALALFVGLAFKRFLD